MSETDMQINAMLDPGNNNNSSSYIYQTLNSSNLDNNFSNTEHNPDYYICMEPQTRKVFNASFWSITILANLATIYQVIKSIRRKCPTEVDFANIQYYKWILKLAEQLMRFHYIYVSVRYARIYVDKFPLIIIIFADLYNLMNIILHGPADAQVRDAKGLLWSMKIYLEYYCIDRVIWDPYFMDWLYLILCSINLGLILVKFPNSAPPTSRFEVMNCKRNFLHLNEEETRINIGCGAVPMFLTRLISFYLNQNKHYEKKFVNKIQLRLYVYCYYSTSVDTRPLDGIIMGFWAMHNLCNILVITGILNKKIIMDDTITCSESEETFTEQMERT